MEGDLVVGIDIGTSGTGVAWGRTDTKRVEFLRWDEALDIVKTPTRLFYCDDEVAGWGLKAPDHQRTDIVSHEWFKLQLDQGLQRTDKVRRLYTDFLTCLHQEISGHYASKMLGKTPWKDARIHFLFSVPATWDALTVEAFRDFASAAGFDKPSGHSLDIGLTEPQAVAAFQLCYGNTTFGFEPGQVVLVVDAGGGTGDFCLLEVQENENGQRYAVELQPVSGNAIGSVYIDQEFEHKAKQALESLQPGPSPTVGDIAWNMRRSPEFQDAKHDFGTSPVQIYPFPVSDYMGDLQGPLRRENLVFDRLDMQELFDAQVHLLEQHIVRSASWLKEKRGQMGHIDYVLLSGGLGSSPYVDQKIQKVCAKFGLEDHKVTKVVTSDDPRLSVCRGLVYHALQNSDLFPQVECRAAFGILCKIPDSRSVEARWKPVLKRAKKDGIPKVLDPVTGKESYQCVDWVLAKMMGTDFEATVPLLTSHQGIKIKTGQTIDYSQYADFPENTPPQQRIIEVKIVTSQEDYPSPFKKGGPRTLASMRVHLSRVDESDIERPKGGKRLLHKMMEDLHIQDSPIKIKFVIEAKIGLARASFQCCEKTPGDMLST